MDKDNNLFFQWEDDSPQATPKEMKRCRLCLENCTSFIEIFKDEFPKMIYNLTRLKVWPDDRMPNISCIPCALEVKQAMLVRKKILTSYKNLLAELNPEINKARRYKIKQENESPSSDHLRYASPPPLAPLTEDYVAVANLATPELRSENHSDNYHTQETITYIPEQDGNFDLMEGSTDGNCFQLIAKSEDGEYEQIIIAVEPDQANEEDFRAEEDSDAIYIQQNYEEHRVFKRKRKIDLNTSVQEDFSEQTDPGMKIKFRRKQQSNISEKIPCSYCNKLFFRYNLGRHLRNCHLDKNSKPDVDLIEIQGVPLQLDQPKKPKVKCGVCGKFLHYSSLWRHMKNHKALKQSQDKERDD